MNSITLICQIVSAPEVRFASTGNENPPKIAQCLVRFLHGYGENQKESQVVAEAWNGVGEKLAGMQIGQALLIRGRVDINKIERPEGFKEYKATVIATELITVSDFIQFNSIAIAGNVGQDPDVKYFESGRNNAKTTVAVSATKKRTNWFNVELWGKTAETMSNYVNKGDKIGIVGEFSLEVWNDRDTGVLRSKPVVKGESLSLLGKSGNASSGSESYDEEF